MISPKLQRNDLSLEITLLLFILFILHPPVFNDSKSESLDKFCFNEQASLNVIHHKSRHSFSEIQIPQNVNSKGDGMLALTAGL